jgi:hypothetical protein
VLAFSETPSKNFGLYQMTRPGIAPASFRPTAQEGKNVSSIMIFAEQFKAVAGRRLAMMKEGIDTFFSTRHRLFPASPPSHLFGTGSLDATTLRLW